MQCRSAQAAMPCTWHGGQRKTAAQRRPARHAGQACSHVLHRLKARQCQQRWCLPPPAAAPHLPRKESTPVYAAFKVLFNSPGIAEDLYVRMSPRHNARGSNRSWNARRASVSWSRDIQMLVRLRAEDLTLRLSKVSELLLQHDNHCVQAKHAARYHKLCPCLLVRHTSSGCPLKPVVPSVSRRLWATTAFLSDI